MTVHDAGVSVSFPALAILAASNFGVFSVTDPRFGARGNGVADDTAAINAAVAAASAVPGATVYFPPGTYKVTSMLTIGGTLAVLGAGAAGPLTGGTRILWAGNNTDALFRLFGMRDSLFAGLHVVSSSAAPLFDAFRSETKAGAASTNNAFRDLIIEGTNAGGLQRGFAYITGTGGDANNAENYFERVTVNNYSDAAWDFTHGQSTNHMFEKCAFSGNRIGQIGVRAAAGVAYQWYGGGGGGNLATDFHTEGAAQPTVLQGVISENSAKLVRTGASGSSVAPFSIRDSSFNCTLLGADNRAIDYQMRGPLIIDNLAIVGPGTKATEIYFNSAPNGNYMYTVRGLRIDTTRADPFTGQPPQVKEAVFITPANTFLMSSYNNVQGIAGAAATAAPAKNLRGSIQITGAASAVAVAFPTAELDASYYIATSTNVVGGAPAAAATRANISARTAAGFNILLEAAPGVGNTVEVQWILVR